MIRLDDAEGLALAAPGGFRHRFIGPLDAEIALEPWLSCFHAVPGLSQISVLPTVGLNALLRLSTK
jgi:hypothetical protein